ncbi:hypothetical protein Tco_1499814 [Tanacetum coccineum]
MNPICTSDPANNFAPNGEETVTLEKESTIIIDKDKIVQLHPIHCDSGGTKHMTGNLSFCVLCGEISGYCSFLEMISLLQSCYWRSDSRNVTIKTVCYVEGLITIFSSFSGGQSVNGSILGGGAFQENLLVIVRDLQGNDY